jgi:hypothetical protein
MEWLATLLSPGWVGSIISLIGLVAALIIYRASKVGARPAFQVRGIKLIGSNAELPEEVTILFQGRKVPLLAKTEIVFWNSGQALCKGSDVVVEDQIRCDFGNDATVLRVRILKSTRPANKFLALPNPGAANEVLLQFDYLDPGDGATVEVLHTGEKRHPDLRGTIRGVPRGILNLGRIGNNPLAIVLRRPLSRVVRVLPYLVLVLGLGLVVAGLVIPDSVFGAREPRPPRMSASATRTMLIILGVLYLLPLVMFWKGRRRFPKALHTEEIED